MKTSKRMDTAIAIFGVLIIIAFMFIVNSCSVRAQVEMYKNNQEMLENRNNDFIQLVKITDIIVMDKHTGVLYVRELQRTYSTYKIYTTFPIMEADGTCLTYDEYKERIKK